MADDRPQGVHLDAWEIEQRIDGHPNLVERFAQGDLNALSELFHAVLNPADSAGR